MNKKMNALGVIVIASISVQSIALDSPVVGSGFSPLEFTVGAESSVYELLLGDVLFSKTTSKTCLDTIDASLGNRVGCLREYGVSMTEYGDLKVSGSHDYVNGGEYHEAVLLGRMPDFGLPEIEEEELVQAIVVGAIPGAEGLDENLNVVSQIRQGSQLAQEAESYSASVDFKYRASSEHADGTGQYVGIGSSQLHVVQYQSSGLSDKVVFKTPIAVIGNATQYQYDLAEFDYPNTVYPNQFPEIWFTYSISYDAETHQLTHKLISKGDGGLSYNKKHVVDNVFPQLLDAPLTLWFNSNFNTYPASTSIVVNNYVDIDSQLVNVYHSNLSPFTYGDGLYDDSSRQASSIHVLGPLSVNADGLLEPEYHAKVDTDNFRLPSGVDGLGDNFNVALLTDTDGYGITRLSYITTSTEAELSQYLSEQPYGDYSLVKFYNNILLPQGAGLDYKTSNGIATTSIPQAPSALMDVINDIAPGVGPRDLLLSKVCNSVVLAGQGGQTNLDLANGKLSEAEAKARKLSNKNWITEEQELQLLAWLTELKTLLNQDMNEYVRVQSSFPYTMCTEQAVIADVDVYNTKVATVADGIELSALVPNEGTPIGEFQSVSSINTVTVNSQEIGSYFYLDADIETGYGSYYLGFSNGTEMLAYLIIGVDASGSFLYFANSVEQAFYENVDLFRKPIAVTIKQISQSEYRLSLYNSSDADADAAFSHVYHAGVNQIHNVEDLKNLLVSGEGNDVTVKQYTVPPVSYNKVKILGEVIAP